MMLYEVDGTAAKYSVVEKRVKLRVYRNEKKMRKMEKIRTRIIVAILGICMVAMLSFPMMLKVKIVQLSAQNTSMSEQIENIKSENQYYKNIYNQKAASPEVKDYAINVLGMVPYDESNTRYIKQPTCKVQIKKNKTLLDDIKPVFECIIKNEF